MKPNQDAQASQGRAVHSPHSRGPRDERGVLEDRIAAAARESFAREGGGGTSMRAVARQAGVDPALVHYYFGSKEALLDASTMPPAEWVASIGRANAQPLAARGEAIVRNLVWTW